MSELPEGWIWTTIDSISVNHDGKRIPVRRTDRAAVQGSYPYYGASGIIDSVSGYLFDGDYLLVAEDGANLLSRSTPIAFRASGKFWVNNHAHVLTTIEDIPLSYVEYYLNGLNLSQFVTGSAQPKLTQRNLNQIPIPLAPLAEQKRIADKLDALLARVDRTRARLDRVPLILKRFRQAVLAAATSGQLTEDWREGSNDEFASINFVDADCFGDYRFPESWTVTRLGEVADVMGGITKDAKKQDQADEELPYLRVANVQRGFLDLSEIKTIRVPQRRLADLLLQKGDILFNEGGDIDKLGRGWIWSGEIERCTFQNHVFRARLRDQRFAPKFFSWYGNSRGYDYFLSNGKQTTNLASINRTLVSALPIVVPHPDEQHEIVRRVEILFAFADRLQARYQAARAQVEQLTSALLAKAFRGELVPQDPNDEPAAALLARVRSGK